MMTLNDPRINRLNAALRHDDRAWGYHMLLSEDRLYMDAQLVRHNHPLAFQAGTNEQRFYALHAAGTRFDELGRFV